MFMTADLRASDANLRKYGDFASVGRAVLRSIGRLRPGPGAEGKEDEKEERVRR